jgi:hypothetical protein
MRGDQQNRTSTRGACGWCDSTHIADAHTCVCREECEAGWCSAAEDLREVAYL